MILCLCGCRRRYVVRRRWPSVELYSWKNSRGELRSWRRGDSGMSKRGKTGNTYMSAPAQCWCIHGSLHLRIGWTKSKAENDIISPGFRPDSSHKRMASPSNTPPVGTTSPSPTPPATPARRGDFTRGEYARRQQLRIMDDLDKVLQQQQKSTNQGRSSTKKTRSRPRSMTREETKLSLSPAKGTAGMIFTELCVCRWFQWSCFNILIIMFLQELSWPKCTPTPPSTWQPRTRQGAKVQTLQRNPTGTLLHSSSAALLSFIQFLAITLAELWGKDNNISMTGH